MDILGRSENRKRNQQNKITEQQHQGKKKGKKSSKQEILQVS